MTTPYSLGAIDVLPVRDYTKPTPPSWVQRMNLLDDGTGTINTEVLQSGSPTRRTGKIGSMLWDSTIADQLQAYYEASTIVTFQDPFGYTASVIIIDLEIDVVWNDPYVGSYQATIVEAA